MIDPISLGGVKPTAAKAAPTQAQTSKPKINVGVSGSQIESAKSPHRLLSLAKELVEAGPPVDYQKIAQIRTAIAQGSYKISNDDLAAAITDLGIKQ